MYSVRLMESQDREKLISIIAFFMNEEGVQIDRRSIAENLALMMESSTAYIWVVENSSEDLLGFATATLTQGLEFGLAAEIEDLYIISRHRGKGIAKRLIEEIGSWSETIGVKQLFLIVTPDGLNQGLEEFYTKLNFHKSNRTIFYR